MAEIKEFIINDRRKFTAEGDARPDAPPSEPRLPRPEALLPPEPESSARLIDTHTAPEPEAPHAHSDEQAPYDDQAPPAPSAEQTQQAAAAYHATVDRLDTAIRANNPAMGPIPPMTFERVIQSIYMQAIVQLGGAAAPGQKPQVDILGARQTIDMVTILMEKSRGNLTAAEDNLLQSALFELHMGFLEVTQALARQAAQQQPLPGTSPQPKGPSIVR
jgi:hypothetical protein